MRGRWFVRLLGELSAERGGQEVRRFRTRKAAALLAYLAYHRGRDHPREALVRLLWPESPPAAGQTNLRVALTSLRHQLEPPGTGPGSVIRGDRNSVGLNVEAVTTDVAEFEAALRAAARRSEPVEAARALAAALELYGGELLPDCRDEWVAPARARLAEARLQALLRLGGCLEAAGDLPAAVDAARRAVAADPLREEGCRDLMRLLAAAGQPAAAMREYRELAHHLRESLGVRPEAATERLAGAIEGATHAPAGSGGAAPQPDPLPSVGPVGPPAAAVPAAATNAARRPPAGTVTFVFVELDASPAGEERSGARGRAEALERLAGEVPRWGGFLTRRTRVGFVAAFQRVGDGLAGAVAGARAVPGAQARLRMALETADVALEGGEYAAADLQRGRQLLRAARAGQVLCSEATAVVARDQLPPGWRLEELGLFQLAGVPAPARLFQVMYPGPGPDGEPRLLHPNAPLARAATVPLPVTRFFGREAEIQQLVLLLQPPASRGAEGQGRSGPAPSPSQSPLLAAPRLVTLTGPGGGGKTRLAVEVAQRLMEAFRGAVWFVPLEDLRDARRLPDLIGEGLGLARAVGVAPLSRVVAALGRRPCLLVLDSFEQLLASAEGGSSQEAAMEPAGHSEPGSSRSPSRAPHSATGLVRALLREAAGLICLTTSRRALGMEEERQFPVPLLPVPPGPLPPVELAACESVQLFVDRAQGVRPDFQLTERNAAAVAELCARLEGIPLAIELAAARVRLLTPSQMIQQLGRAPGARLGLLAGRRPGVERRHSTLRDTIDWSYQLLSADLQRLFARLSVFRGGFTLEAATSIADCGLRIAELGKGPSGQSGIRKPHAAIGESAIHNPQSAIDSLEALQDSSLLLVETGPEGDEPRFRMLETLREFAAEQLEPEEAQSAAAAHARYFLGLAERAEAELRGPTQARWFERLEREHDNLRAAIAYCLGEGEPDRSTAGGDERSGAPGLHARGSIAGRRDAALRLAARLWRFWLVRCHVEEGRRCLAAALAGTGSPESRGDRAEALLGAGVLARSLVDHAAAQRLLEESLATYRDLGNEEGTARALANLGIAWRERGDLGSARTRIEEAIAILRLLGRQRYVAIYLVDLAHVLRQQGDPAAARAVLEESLGIERELGDTWGIAAAAGALAVACAAAGDAAQARALYQETVALAHELGDRRCIAGNQLRLALLAWEQNEPAAAGAFLREALPVYRQFAELLDLEQGLALAAALAAAVGQAEPSARLLGAAAVFREAASAPATGVPPIPLEPLLRSLRATLGETRFAAAWAAGRGLSLAESVDLALAAAWAGASAQGPP